MAATRLGGLNFRRDGSQPWSWAEVAVLKALIELGCTRHMTARIMQRGYNQVAGVCHRNHIKIRARMKELT